MINTVKSLMFKSTPIKVAILYSSWKIFLLLILLLSINYFPLGSKDRFLGGGVNNYFLFPEIFSWANFDGEHYLSIAIFGYKGLEQAFFPIYPLLINLFSKPFYYDLNLTIFVSILVGLIISSVAFFLALLILWELIKIDYPEKIGLWTTIILLLFPTSFYFNSLYNESLFLLFSLSSFYFARKGNWLLAGVLGSISSATRIFGLLIFPPLLIEALSQKASVKRFFWIFLIPLGLIFYMLYQWVSIGDPFAFYKVQKLVGEQHQSNFILLPQVYFRYLKMLFSTDISNPIYQTVVLEFIIGIVFFILPIYGYFKKMRISYVIYAITGFLLPTIQGSFTSVPRYIIVFFPSFIALSLFINKLPISLRILYLFLSSLLLIFEASLFLRGFWVA